jgi:hypothetical protein
MRTSAGDRPNSGRKKGLIILLAGACALIYLPMLFRGGDKGRQAAAQEDEAPQATAGSGASPAPGGGGEARPEAKAPAGPPAARRGDPTANVDALFRAEGRSGGEGSEEPRLTGVLALGSERMAVIDGRIVRVGDRVRGYRVAAIREADAVLQSKEGKLMIPLVPAAPSPADERRARSKDAETPAP